MSGPAVATTVILGTGGLLWLGGTVYNQHRRHTTPVAHEEKIAVDRTQSIFTRAVFLRDTDPQTREIRRMKHMIKVPMSNDDPYHYELVPTLNFANMEMAALVEEGRAIQITHGKGRAARANDMNKWIIDASNMLDIVQTYFPVWKEMGWVKLNGDGNIIEPEEFRNLSNALVQNIEVFKHDNESAINDRRRKAQSNVVDAVNKPSQKPQAGLTSWASKLQ
jgi:hypothetical protein